MSLNASLNGWSKYVTLGCHPEGAACAALKKAASINNKTAHKPCGAAMTRTSQVYEGITTGLAAYPFSSLSLQARISTISRQGDDAPNYELKGSEL